MPSTASSWPSRRRRWGSSRRASCSSRWPATPRPPSPRPPSSPQKQGGTDRIHVLASDAAIDRRRQLLAVGRYRGQGRRSSGRLVTFGITPTSPETGYGYIEAGPARGDGTHDVARFVEKPDRDRAEAMLRQGGYYWNSGMFMLGVEAFLEECRAALAREPRPPPRGPSTRPRPTSISSGSIEASFATAPNISVDYAIFEKTASASPWSRSASPGAIWAAGTRCGRSRTRTPTTTPCSDRPRSAIPPTRW